MPPRTPPSGNATSIAGTEPTTTSTQAPTLITQHGASGSVTAGGEAGSRSSLESSTRRPSVLDGLADTRLEPPPAARPTGNRAAPPPRLDTNRRADGFLREEQALHGKAVLDDDPDIGAEALERLRQLDSVQRNFNRLSAGDKARAQDAWEAFQRLRQNNPVLASLDEIDAFARLSEGASRTRGPAGSANRYSTEEIVANFAASRGVAIGPDQLSRAANVSLPNAEGAISASVPHSPTGQLPVFNPAFDVPTPGAATPRPVTPAAPHAAASRSAASPAGSIPAAGAAAAGGDANGAALEALRARTDELFDFNRPVAGKPGTKAPAQAADDELLAALRRRTDELFDFERTVDPLPGGDAAAVDRDAATVRDEAPAVDREAPTVLEEPAATGPRAAAPIVDLPAGALRGQRMSLERPDGSNLEIVIGDFINEGSSNQVYRLDSAPGKVVRMSRVPSEHIQARFDLAGRRAIEDAVPALGGELEVVNAELFPAARSSTPELNGRTFLIMDEVNVRALEQLARNPGGMPSAGQAIAYDRGLRALNRTGLAMLDGHPANFYFRKVAEPDDWVMVVIDAGGIVPARGASQAERAAHAREIQALVDDPANRPPVALHRRGPFEYVNKAIDMEEPLARLLDENALRGLGGIERLDQLFVDEPLFRPSGAEDFPMVRRLFATGDDEIEAAYSALRNALE